MTVKTDDLKAALYRDRLRTKIDPRIIACQVSVERTGRTLTVRGFTMYPQTDTFARAAAAEIFGEQQVRIELQVLTRDFPCRFYRIVAPTAGFYREAKIGGTFDLLTEGTYATVVRGWFSQDGFVLAQHNDGYVGYVQESALQETGREDYLRWKNSAYALLRHPLTIDGLSLPAGTRLVRRGTRVLLADGRLASLPRGAAMTFTPNSPSRFNRIMKHAQAFASARYQWGRRTEEAIDCSGFVQAVFMREHVLLPRDASMQAYVGEMVGYGKDVEDLLPGDLVFFMNDTAHVYHVGIYTGNRRFIHASYQRGITESSLDRADETYIERFGKTIVFGRRVCLA